MSTTLSNIGQAAADAELLERISSAAAEAGLDNSARWAEMNARRIVSVPVNPIGETLASVYAYAAATYVPAPTPGANPAAVTDTMIRKAVTDVKAAKV